MLQRVPALFRSAVTGSTAAGPDRPDGGHENANAAFPGERASAPGATVTKTDGGTQTESVPDRSVETGPGDVGVDRDAEALREVGHTVPEEAPNPIVAVEETVLDAEEVAISAGEVVAATRKQTAGVTRVDAAFTEIAVR